MKKQNNLLFIQLSRRENRRFNPATDSVLNLDGRECTEAAVNEPCLDWRGGRRSDLCLFVYTHIFHQCLYPQRLKTVVDYNKQIETRRQVQCTVSVKSRHVQLTGHKSYFTNFSFIFCGEVVTSVASKAARVSSNPLSRYATGFWDHPRLILPVVIYYRNYGQITRIVHRMS